MKITLYKQDARETIRVFIIEDFYRCAPGGIETSWGCLGGEMQTQFEYITYGKAGRTLREQIDSRMNSIMNKKFDSGYVRDLKEAQSEKPTNQLGFHRPMRGKVWTEVKDIDWSHVYVQFKYNGHRCMITCRDGKNIAYSRNGKEIFTIKPILKKLRIPEGRTIDGELYIHGLKLQKISSIVKRIQPGNKRLIFVGYDYISPDCYKVRQQCLRTCIRGRRSVVARTTRVQHDNPNIALRLTEALSDGYEGLMLRVNDCGYESGKKSSSLLKVKQVLDEEFLVVDVIPSSEGWGRLVCVTKEGKRFGVSAPGSTLDKLWVMDYKSSFIGRFVNVEFAEWTLEGKPFHPVATIFRDKGSE